MAKSGWTLQNIASASVCWAAVAWSAVVASAVACGAAGTAADKTGAAAPAGAAARLAYPPSKMADQVDDYHGEKVADPFRWLESDGPDTAAWITAQNQLTRSYLDAVPQRGAIRKRLEQVWNYPKVSSPLVEGGRVFWRRNDGMQNQAVLCWSEKDDGKCQLLLDPNTLTSDGTAALQSYSVTRDGKVLAYAIAQAGSDWNQIRVQEVGGKALPDKIDWVKFSGLTWSADGKGFWYNRYDAPKEGEKLTGINKYQKLMYHLLGTEQAQDKLVYERPDQPEWGFGADISDDGRWLVVAVHRGADKKNGILVQDLQEGRAKLFPGLVEVVSGFGAAFEFAGSSGETLYFRTDHGSPRGKVLALDLGNWQMAKNPSPLNSDGAATPVGWRVIAEEKADTLQSAFLAGQGLVLAYLRNAASTLEFVDLQGKPLAKPQVPELGTLSGFSGKQGQAALYYMFTGFLAPPQVHRLDLATGQSTTWFKAPAGLSASEYEVSQPKAKSKDGTEVPVFVVHKKGLKRDGNAPAYLYGYGGFGVSITPFYRPMLQAWLEAGGVVAVAVLRGGAEYGDAWHKGGQLGNKQNVFDDFHAAAEMLTSSGLSGKGRIAIAGGSNGGLLVGACLIQRPDLYGAALPDVGVMDMLRYHKFTIGYAWVPEYGSAEDPKAFAWLRKYSPLHTLKAGTAYPATLVGTADHDDRVVPAHSFKFAAALQAAQGGPAPALIRIDTKAGHGAGKPTAKQVDEATDKLAFLFHTLAIPAPEAWR